MRDIEFYETRGEYEEAIFDSFLPILRENPFYRNLIQLVVDQYSPLFYQVSDPSEHFAFSGAYHWETRRKRYPNKARENLFWLHDFTHMLFSYAHDLWNVTEKQFLDDFVYQERLASTETEVFAYYRVEGLRDLVFEDEVLYYDVITKRGWYDHWDRKDATQKPDALEFLEHRHKMVLDDTHGEFEIGAWTDDPQPAMLKFFRQWRRLTPNWCSQRYRSMAGVRVPQYDWFRTSGGLYEQIIENYDTMRRGSRWTTEEMYRDNVMKNVHIAYALMGWTDPPQRWRHMGQAIDKLEGAVFFK